MDAEERERRELALNLAVQFGVGLAGRQGLVSAADIIGNAAKFEAFLAGNGAKASA